MGTPGSPQLMQRLVDEHYLALYRYAFRLSGSAADAEDLTQEAYCKAQLNLGQLRDLAEVFRTPVILYYFEDFSYRDIAEQMDLPIGTVMSRLARAKTYLRLRLLPLTAAASDTVTTAGP